MLLQCHAIVPDQELRQELTKKLRHHGVPFEEEKESINIEAHFLSYRSIEKLLEYFKQAEPLEYGFSVIGDRKEVPHDTG